MLTERLAAQEGGLIKGKSCLSLVESEARLSLRGREGGWCQGLRRVGCVVMATGQAWRALPGAQLRLETQLQSSGCPEPARPR